MPRRGSHRNISPTAARPSRRPIGPRWRRRLRSTSRSVFASHVTSRGRRNRQRAPRNDWPDVNDLIATAHMEPVVQVHRWIPMAHDQTDFVADANLPPRIGQRQDAVLVAGPLIADIPEVPGLRRLMIGGRRLVPRIDGDESLHRLAYRR